jgi:hypothetical protein
MAHDMVGKESGMPDLTGVSGLLIRSGGSANPFARVAAHSNSSSKKLGRIKRDLVPYNVISCTAQFIPMRFLTSDSQVWEIGH